MPDSPSDPRFSVRGEPWAGERPPRPHKSRHHIRAKPDIPAELDALRDSIHAEPDHEDTGEAARRFANWFETGRRRTTALSSAVSVGLAALAAGPFAIVGALMTGRQTAFSLIYVILFGPITEELLKQSGIVFLLERLPYRIRTRGQIVGGAVCAALVFACVENLLYRHLYCAGLPPHTLATVMTFRWLVCTALHVLCSAIASIGLIRVWEIQTRRFTPADFSRAYPFFAIAMAIHGVYNLIAVLTADRFFF